MKIAKVEPVFYHVVTIDLGNGYRIYHRNAADDWESYCPEHADFWPSDMTEELETMYQQHLKLTQG